MKTPSYFLELAMEQQGFFQLCRATALPTSVSLHFISVRWASFGWPIVISIHKCGFEFGWFGAISLRR